MTGRYVHLVGAVGIVVLLAVVSIPHAGATDEVIDVAVRFDVANVNRSALDCDSDGAGYTVHASLVAPASALAASTPAVTLYLHGFEMGEPLWRGMDLGAPYDYARTMAEHGHASITIDLIGYGTSVTEDGPDGFLVCYGSVADITHQIVDQLRHGSYTAEGLEPPTFDRVGVAGFAGYAPAAQLMAYSFGGIDALILIGYAGMIGNPHALALISANVTTGCRLNEGADPKWDDRPGPSNGYYWHFSRDDAADWWFEDTDPGVREAWTRTMERDPCGAPSSALQTWLRTDTQGLGTIDLPVLIALGERDRVYPPQSGMVHAQRFTGSDDVELRIFPEAGHLFHLERQRATWIGDMSGWLEERGL